MFLILFKFQINKIYIERVALRAISCVVVIEGCRLYKNLPHTKLRQKKNPEMRKYAMPNGGLSFIDAPVRIVFALDRGG